MEFKVENHIPLPTRTKRGPGETKTAVHKQMNRIMPGQSFVVPCSYAWTKVMFDEFCKKESDRKYILKATRKGKKDLKQTRIWRTK